MILSSALKNQKGIAPILMILLLLTGVGVGTYLVQQRTNLIPHASKGTPDCNANVQRKEAKTDSKGCPTGQLRKYKFNCQGSSSTHVINPSSNTCEAESKLNIKARALCLSLLPKSCIPSPKPSPSPTSNDHVYILELTEDEMEADGFDEIKAIKKFYLGNPGKVNSYDFIALLPSFLTPTDDNGVAGYYNVARNKVRGICTHTTSLSDSEMIQEFGSSKLQGYHRYYFSHMNKILNNPIALSKVFLEETSHQWLARVGNRAPLLDGSLPSGIQRSCLEKVDWLSGDSAHWAAGLQSPPGYPPGMREAKPWVDNGNGTFSYDFTLIFESPSKFSPFDMYLMGLMDKSEVTGEYLLLTDMQTVFPSQSSLPSAQSLFPPPSGDPVIDLPSETVKANSRKITINDIIRVAGEERSPGVSTSQKYFNLAFVILKKPGIEVPSDFLTGINKAAIDFPSKWAYATDNRSTMNK